LNIIESFPEVLMSMSIRASLLFVMSATAANAFGSSDACIKEDINMFLQVPKSMTTPRNGNLSLGEWKRYRRRPRRRRQHRHDYYAPDSTTLSTSTTVKTTTTTSTSCGPCEKVGFTYSFTIADAVTLLPESTNVINAGNPDPDQACCCVQVIQLRVRFLSRLEKRAFSRDLFQVFRALITSPVSQDIQIPIVRKPPEVIFQISVDNLPTADVRGQWNVTFFYEEEQEGKDVKVTINYDAESCNGDVVPFG